MAQLNWIFILNCLSQWVTATNNLFCLTHWVTVTNIILGWLQWVTVTKKFLLFWKKMPKRSKHARFFWYFLLFLALFVPFWQYLCLILWFFLFFIWVFFVAYIPILFVAVTQCNKQKIYLSQWLSVTNKFFCHSDSVQQTILKKKYPISLWHVTKELKKKQENKHSFTFEFPHRYQTALGYLLYFMCPWLNKIYQIKFKLLSVQSV